MRKRQKAFFSEFQQNTPPPLLQHSFLTSTTSNNCKRLAHKTIHHELRTAVTYLQFGGDHCRLVANHH